MENRVNQHQIRIDFNEVIRKKLVEAGSPPIWRRVRFDDVPVIIQPIDMVDEYNITIDINLQKANVTIG